MAYAEPCIGVKDTVCVDACPVDCIHPRRNEPLSTKIYSFTSTRRNVSIVGPAFRYAPYLQSLRCMIFRALWADYENINRVFREREG